ncbi:MAG: TlpA family protein disulfide reductase [Oscillospiraceae bacterium]|nr:TlpA family protein disulfide reductase [Oscillospiraceae bacterium]
MKKLISVILLVVLLAAAMSSAACADAGIGIEPGQPMPDFTVSLTDGTTATLSELLKEKDLVVLNIFASFCVPCEREFPEMEEVYQENKDRMEIVSVSGYSEDTMEDIAEYKASHNLSFPMGLTGDALDFLGYSSYPTTLLIDGNGKVGLIKVGSFTSKEEFEGKVNHFLSADYSGETLKTEKAVNISKYIYVWILVGGILMIIGRWGILRKAGKKGWHSLVPLLNVYKEYSTVWNGWLGVLAGLCFPVGVICNIAKLPAAIYYVLLAVGFLISVPESIKLAKAFGKGTVFGLLMTIPGFKEIGRLILGFGKAKYISQ